MPAPVSPSNLGTSLSFRSLSVTISASSASPSPSSPSPLPRSLLSRASGEVRGGSLCAILGASGAGKTTLLNCLAHRDDGGLYTGDVLINGRVESAEYFSSHCGFVPQQSVLLPALTPRETIAFASHMKLPPHTAEAEHSRTTERIIAALSLGRCADSQVGDDIVGGLSGGEKRRVNVGVELVTTPSILFLDGPHTSLSVPFMTVS
jgi:ABC-type multidrug transport system ATPase subunit